MHLIANRGFVRRFSSASCTFSSAEGSPCRPISLGVWRLAAWVASAVVAAAHLGYEHFLLNNSPRATALHAAIAVAFGAFTLALAANIHDLGSASGYRPRMLIALVAWPLLTAVPAFIVALAAAAVLARLVTKRLRE
ncbi:MAG: hypothetical protein LC776_16735 [Acidobacteria bacterium]|nr:hypothetical protein [Acidobacteriota bacterium]